MDSILQTRSHAARQRREGSKWSEAYWRVFFFSFIWIFSHKCFTDKSCVEQFSPFAVHCVWKIHYSPGDMCRHAWQRWSWRNTKKKKHVLIFIVVCHTIAYDCFLFIFWISFSRSKWLRGVSFHLSHEFAFSGYFVSAPLFFAQFKQTLWNSNNSISRAWWGPRAAHNMKKLWSNTLEQSTQKISTQNTECFLSRIIKIRWTGNSF